MNRKYSWAKQAPKIFIFLILSFLPIISASCSNLEFLSPLRDYLNTQIPENKLETLEPEEPHF